MSDPSPDVIPMLTYEDGFAAMDWLCRAFGFVESTRMADESGRLMHGELRTGNGFVMLASPTAAYQGPRRHRQHCDRAQEWSAGPWIVDGVLVLVDDVDAHFTHAKREGAVILSEPEDGPPARRYRAEDLEGHRWMFMAR